MPFIIQTQNLTKKFGNFIAVNNLIEKTNTKNLEDAFLILSKQNIIRNEIMR